MQQIKINPSNFYNLIEENGFYTKGDRLKFYLEKYLFKGLNFEGKKLIDIGGGNGLFGFYAAINGAEKVVIMEPEFDGSTAGIQKEFERLRALFGNLENIEFSKDTLQVYDSKHKFDVVLLHNSINHLDEEACEQLHKEESARKKYLAVLAILTSICKEGAELIVSDCSRKNFYPAIGLSSPFAKSIEWEKHQSPELWTSLLSEVGFKKQSLSWSSYNGLKSFGRLLFGNRIAAYFLFSHFMLKLKYQP